MKSIDLISRKVLLAEYDRHHEGTPGKARELIANAPAVDAEKVVRCKECVCSFMFSDERLCSQFYEKLVHDDDYCSFGERRNNA